MITQSDKAFIATIVVFVLLSAAQYFHIAVDDNLKNTLLALLTGGAVWTTPNKGA